MENTALESPVNIETRQVSMSIKLIFTLVSSLIVIISTICATYASIMRTIDKNHNENILMFQQANLQKVISENETDKRDSRIEAEIKEISRRLDVLEAKNNR